MGLLYSEAVISPVGKLNKADINKIIRYTIIFFAAPTLMYLGQLQGTLTENHIIRLVDLVPNSVTIGALEGWAIGVLINFFLKLKNGNS